MFRLLKFCSCSPSAQGFTAFHCSSALKGTVGFTGTEINNGLCVLSLSLYISESRNKQHGP